MAATPPKSGPANFQSQKVAQTRQRSLLHQTSAVLREPQDIVTAGGVGSQARVQRDIVPALILGVPVRKPTSAGALAVSKGSEVVNLGSPFTKPYWPTLSWITDSTFQLRGVTGARPSAQGRGQIKPVKLIGETEVSSRLVGIAQAHQSGPAKPKPPPVRSTAGRRRSHALK